MPSPAQAAVTTDETSSSVADIAADWSNINVMKPPPDKRDYTVEILENGLRVIYCSDPSSTEAGCAMDVHVGATSDPNDIPGLAHFNEHMLFLGTKEYPNENSFEEFLSANGGSSNAYTASENTCYYFTLQAEADEKLNEGLKRFGSFFTSPLFTENATGRELNAIESENSKNLQSDGFRIYQINKARQNPDHPHSKFFTGNKKTLLDETKKKGLDLRQSLIEFYNKYYSADQMTLAVVGPQSIETLKKMTHGAFSNIPNRKTNPPEDAWKRIVPPYDAEKSIIPSFGNIVKIVPVSDLRQVTITFPILYKDENEHTEALLTKQSTYVGHVIGHEGPGSLLSYLKGKGWVNSIASGSESDLSDFETFEVTVALTRLGLEKVDEIIESIFSVISMLRDNIIPKYIFNEVLQLEELGWRFASKGGVSSYVQSLSSSLQKYPPSLSVAGPQFVDNLTVDNALYTILSKSFKGQTNQKEFWYGTDYRADPVPVSTTLRWKNPTNTSNVQRQRTFEERMVPIPPPKIIRDDGPDGRWTVYYKPDDKFGQPKAFVIFELLTKEVYSSVKSAALSNMYEFCVADKLGEYAYDAGLAGLTYDVRIVPRGVRLTFGGYNDKLEDFAKYVTKQITTNLKNILPKDEAEFDRYQDLLIRSFAGFDVKQPYSHCAYYSQLMLQPPGYQYNNQELLEATKKVTLPELISYVGSVWSSGKGIALVQGNVDENQAKALVSTIDKALAFKPISATEIPAELVPLPIPESSAGSMGTRLVISEPNAENSNAASYVAIQSLSEDPKEHVMMELIGAVVAEPFYEELRTRQQLGYIVNCGVRPVGKTQTLGFIVQSSTAKNEKLTNEIKKFLDTIRPKFLEKIDEAKLAVYVKSLIDRKTEPDKQLATEATRNWAEIASGRLQFDRPQRDVAALLDLTTEDILGFWDQIYLKDGRRVITTEMIPQVGATSAPLPPKSTGYTPSSASTNKSSGSLLGIDDIEIFRQNSATL
ncbi:Peptidase_M16-domain-containing protein [Fragilariopsis cylindrus CCMP1102]|uniref:Peptidase_M16-domain-containing protein n=1 Tax=Fragilariopsis cylindrus CCMP1102 TaxID=635003 RepID=A0A1E7FCU1_9STRA|nr:Peptidase_M16-domain-containing protein [Fragilariopsis cylindrus CCMP1102]|eukprot:OEU15623.1 Peptidase_M16-domain-containing protein [Fragilariopsis cylindrus CCMP1102]